MLIAISQRIDFIPSRNEYRDSVDQNLLRLIIELGHIPIQVPNVLLVKNKNQKLVEWLKKINPQGLILSGGNDINEHEKRDDTEKFLYTWAKNKKKPILGICRGMQLIGIINNIKLKQVSNHVSINHPIISVNNLKQIRNSFHDYSLKNCPEGFEVLFYSEDGEIESIRHKIDRIFGIMWHPEREYPFLKEDLKMIRLIFND